MAKDTETRQTGDKLAEDLKTVLEDHYSKMRSEAIKRGLRRRRSVRSRTSGKAL